MINQGGAGLMSLAAENHGIETKVMGNFFILIRDARPGFVSRETGGVAAR
jgi:hypothetical protein